MNTGLTTKTDLAELKASLEKTIVQTSRKNVTTIVTWTTAIVAVWLIVLTAIFT